MPDDFASAAVRHWDNSAFLLEQNRLQEAAYLAGYVAECSLKFCEQKANLAPRPFGHDMNLLSSAGLELAQLLVPLMKRYQISVPLTDLFDWSETQRYESTGFMNDAKLQSIIQQAHGIAEEILVPMILDGYLEEFPK